MFRSHDISPSPNSIWVRIWKKKATVPHTLYFPRLKVPLTALCGGCGVAAVHSHISSQSLLLESPLVALCGQTLALESQGERGEESTVEAMGEEEKQMINNKQGGKKRRGRRVRSGEIKQKQSKRNAAQTLMLKSESSRYFLKIILAVPSN